jgi:hypothetical protein
MLTFTSLSFMELLDIYLTSTYFQFDDKFCQQKDIMTVGSSPSPVVSDIFMIHCEETALDSADHKPTKSLRYIHDTIVVWSCEPARSQQFCHKLSSLRPAIRYTIEVEAIDTLSFLDILVMKRFLNCP